MALHSHYNEGLIIIHYIPIEPLIQMLLVSGHCLSGGPSKIKMAFCGGSARANENSAGTRE